MHSVINLSRESALDALAAIPRDQRKPIHDLCALAIMLPYFVDEPNPMDSTTTPQSTRKKSGNVYARRRAEMANKIPLRRYSPKFKPRNGRTPS